MTEHADPTGAGSLIMIGCDGGPETLSGIAESIGAHARSVLCDPVSPPGAVLSGMPRAGTVRHLKALPSLADGTAEARLYSLPGLISLGAPLAALHALFPGLRERDRRSVDLLGPETFAAELADLPAPLTCVIALPGAEADILDALEATGILGRISTLRLRCGVEPFFEGAAGRDALEARVTAAGFVLASVRSDDPDWPELHFTADPRHHEIDRLESAVQSLESARAEQHAEIAQLRDRLEAREQTLAQQQTELDRLTARLAERDRSLETARKAADDQAATIAALEARLSDATATLDGMRGELRDCQAEMARASERAGALQAAEQRYEQARTELAFQMRVNAMLQRDMDNLRSRFEDSETARRTQEDLLRKLTPKLAQAAHHLHRLQSGDAGATAALTEGPADPATGAADSRAAAERTSQE